MIKFLYRNRKQIKADAEVERVERRAAQERKKVTDAKEALERALADIFSRSEAGE